jgi:tRNA pseudouridine-54 N-methylase
VYFRYPDLTAQAEFIYKALERTVTHDLQQEIDYLVGFDRASKALNKLLDWPAHSLELFIRVVHENGDKLAANKRKSHFTWMRGDEIQAAETQVVAAFNSIQDAATNRNKQ